jgi:hypothetical protein
MALDGGSIQLEQMQDGQGKQTTLEFEGRDIFGGEAGGSQQHGSREFSV